jgi:hypothetical protein
MGNLRQSMTDEEWDNINDRIKKEERDGKPSDNFISIYAADLHIDKLLDLENKLIELGINAHNLYSWIKYKKKG